MKKNANSADVRGLTRPTQKARKSLLKGAVNPGQNLDAGKHQMTSGFLQNPL